MSDVSDRFTVILDANVLYFFRMRDVLLRFAAAGLYRARWSALIIDEFRRNLLARKPQLVDSIAAQISAMARAFPEAAVSSFEDLIKALELPDPDDRHVAAAAIKANAEHIITENFRDFPADTLAKYQLEAVTADDFLTSTFELYPAESVAALRTTRCAYKRPAMSAGEFLLDLQGHGMAKLASSARPHFENL